MASVTLNDVCKIYDNDVMAVKHVDLEIHDKEFMVLVGPSGCGKSTTLRMIAGLEEISLGTIKIGNRVVNDVPPKERDIAMVFQNYALYPHMTVYDNMAFALKLRGFSKEEIKKRVYDAAEILGITDYLERRPKALSGGQRQRVAVGRAIVRKPAVFLFDEPLSNLDAKMRVQMRAEIAKLHTRLNTTMIYVTHDQIEAMTMGTRICVMKDGIIQQLATPLEIYDNPANVFVAGFIGTPPANLITGEFNIENGKLMFKSEKCCFPMPDEWKNILEEKNVSGKVVFGIRPEALGSPDAERDPNAVKIRSTVDVAEPMGAETYLHLAQGFIARVDPHRFCRPGEEVELAMDQSKAHLFDAESGNRII